MKALKILVLVMGMLIVAVLGVTVVTLVQRAGQDEDTTAGRPAGTTVPSARIVGTSPPSFGETTLTLPPGAKILETATGDGRMVLRIREAGGRSALVVIHTATGQPLGVI